MVTKRERDNQVKILDLKINKLLVKRKELTNYERPRKEYTTREAITLMKQGKKMAMGLGSLYEGGYYYDYDFKNQSIITHNGDGTIYAQGWQDCDVWGYNSKVRLWVIVTKKDFYEKYDIKEGIRWK